MAVKGYNFDRQIISPKMDAIVNGHSAAKAQGMIAPATLSISGLTVTLNQSTNRPIIGHLQGYYFEIENGTTLTIAPNTTGYIVVRADLTQVNTFSGVVTDGSYTVDTKQIQLQVVTKANIRKENLIWGGNVRDLVLYSFTSSATTVTVTPFNVNWVYPGGVFNPVKTWGANFSSDPSNAFRAQVVGGMLQFSGVIRNTKHVANGSTICQLNPEQSPDTSWAKGYVVAMQSSSLKGCQVYVAKDGRMSIQNQASSTVVAPLIMDGIAYPCLNNDNYFFPA
ncbi:gp17 [Listeria phage P40]|uniref:tail protein n=1 Tax=Listeria phage P40 TaxID=560178 RepID=UPI00018198D7|nr:tail protein [Listeria phage P40]ACI00377.1 gp17 [Listeria phage P40]